MKGYLVRKRLGIKAIKGELGDSAEWDTGDGELNGGKVEGTITSDRCELMENSKLKGDIKTKKLTMQEGALLDGRMQTGG